MWDTLPLEIQCHIASCHHSVLNILARADKQFGLYVRDNKEYFQKQLEYHKNNLPKNEIEEYFINGMYRRYYYYGLIKISGHLYQGKKHGLYNVYWGDGILMLQQEYKYGNMIKEKVYDKDGTVLIPMI